MHSVIIAKTTRQIQNQLKPKHSTSLAAGVLSTPAASWALAPVNLSPPLLNPAYNFPTRSLQAFAFSFLRKYPSLMVCVCTCVYACVRVCPPSRSKAQFPFSLPKYLASSCRCSCQPHGTQTKTLKVRECGGRRPSRFLIEQTTYWSPVKLCSPCANQLFVTLNTFKTL